MGYEKQKRELKEVLETGYPLLYIVSEDERPVMEALKEVQTQLSRTYEFYSWDLQGRMYNEKAEEYRVKVIKKGDQKEQKNYDSSELMEKIKNQKEHVIGVFHDLHYKFKGKDEYMNRRLKEFFYDVSMPFSPNFSLSKYNRATDPFYKHIIITAPLLEIPKEVEKYFYVIDFGLPQQVEINEIVEDVINEQSIILTKEEQESVINSAIGLTESQIFYALKRSIVKNNGKIDSKDILDEKKQLVKKEGFLEFIDSPVEFKDVGGLHHLIQWIQKRKLAFKEENREKYTITMPKGVMITGVPGCGKSHSVKAISSYLGFPLLRLDIGSLMGGLLGESERNLRKAIKMIESISPCVLWIDEIEKGVPNFKNKDVHETVKRMGSTLLTWLQEKTAPVFVVATANNLDNLAPELLRKGRFDEIFFVDLPNEKDRRDILSIHLQHKKLTPKTFDLSQLSKETYGFSGAEIETLINEAVLEAAINERFAEQIDLIKEIQKTDPMSRTMKEQVETIRTWAIQHNLRLANDLFKEEDTTFGIL